jgi:hypothetical protein
MIGTLLDRADLPKGFAGVDELEAFMARPSRELVDDLARVSGDILVLGAGGKMGPTLAKLARNAAPTKALLPLRGSARRGCGKTSRVTASRPSLAICSIAMASPGCRGLPT